MEIALKRGIKQAYDTMTSEIEQLNASLALPDTVLASAIELLLSVRGKVVVCGLGKSGHIGKKMAASFASTGTPSFFVHAAEALHGDSGMFTVGDVGILISNSGETREVCEVASLMKKTHIPFLALTRSAESSLGRLANVVVPLSYEREADPLGLAPTTSTTVTLLIGDALVCALMAMKGITSEDFFLHHPGGSLGKKLAINAEHGGKEA
ncbi:MAG: SIS domain-containing protein [Arcanobacterium sp.]|nr:SIS domain-containing protein [Arcanobacterium sp.]MDY5589151.1 SIS domain-containing protein [Arcanobacterium sp.]